MAVAAARYLLTRAPRPTALFAGNEEMLMGVLAAAAEMKLDIGGDRTSGSIELPTTLVDRSSIADLRDQPKQ